MVTAGLSPAWCMLTSYFKGMKKSITVIMTAAPRHTAENNSVVYMIKCVMAWPPFKVWLEIFYPAPPLLILEERVKNLKRQGTSRPPLFQIVD